MALRFVTCLVATEKFNKLSKIVEDSSKKRATVLSAHISPKITLGVVVVVEDYLEKVLLALTQIGVRIVGVMALSVDEIIAQLDRCLLDLSEGKEEALKEVDELPEKWHKQLLILKDQLLIEAERLNAYSHFGKSGNEVVAHGWVPAKEIDKLTNLINEETKGTATIRVAIPTELEKPPTLLDNPRIFKPFERLIEVFALPFYLEFDPTIILAITFTIFFGVMVSDVLYGALISFFGVVLAYKIGRFDKYLHDLGLILIGVGMSSIIFGFLIGSVIGGLIVPKWSLIKLTPINILLFFGLGFLFGVFHISIGILIALWKNVKQKLYLAAFTEQGVSLLIILSLLLIGAGLNLPKYHWLMDFGPIFIKIGAVLFGACVVIAIVTFKFERVTGIIEIFARVVSYSRLVAIAISGAMIAHAITLLTLKLMALSLIGVILGIFAMVIGHFLNCTLVIVAAFIHSLRLEYVEFFGRFFETWGKKFSPFRVERQFTVIS